MENGIEFNSGSEQNVAVKRLYTGIMNGVVVAINPTKAELEALGINPKEEPVYNSENDGIKKIRIDCFISNPEHKLITKVSYWLEDRVSVGRTSGKTQFINQYGKTAWTMDQSDLSDNEYFIDEGTRPAFVGEELLVDKFLRAWTNAEFNTKDKKFSKILPNTAEFFRGDVSQLKNLVKPLADSGNGVRVLLGVKDDKYQDVYSKHIERPYQKSTNKFKDMLNGDYTQFKSDFNNSFEFMEYTGEKQLIAPDTTTTGSSITEESPF